MEEKILNSCEVSVKLTTHGRYLWTITIASPVEDRQEIVKKIKEVDRLLKEEFPDHVQKGSGRTVNFDEEV